MVADPKNLRKIGKAQAREQFAPLIESLAKDGGVIEVTDYGRVTAVMISYSDYLTLRAQAKEPFKPKRQLFSSAVLVGDLDEAQEEVSSLISESIERTIRDL